MEMTIGKLAKSAAVGVETIRFYERKGLLRRPPKREGSFRYYSPAETGRVHFIKRAQDLGFTLREVKELLDLQTKNRMTGAQVEARAKRKIKEIRGKIADLERMEDSLVKLSRVCGAGEQAIQECRISDCFEKGC
ncbi:MerR family DNA-binding protein [bacterium]|nr:MerR family DNA-binding protein [bacterium]